MLPDMMSGRWQVTDFSGGNGNCPEARYAPDGTGNVELRSTLNPDVVVTFLPGEWEALAASFAAGQYDLR